MELDDEVRRQLNKVVGESFDPPRRLRPTLLKWLAGAILAVGTSAGIVAILHANLTRDHPPVPGKPVTITIVPVAK